MYDKTLQDQHAKYEGVCISFRRILKTGFYGKSTTVHHAIICRKEIKQNPKCYEIIFRETSDMRPVLFVNRQSIKTWWRISMMTSSNGNTFRVTGPLCGEFTGPGEFPHKGQWRGTLMFSLICVWINGWVNNREAGDLRRHRGHYDVNVMCAGELRISTSVNWIIVDLGND